MTEVGPAELLYRIQSSGIVRLRNFPPLVIRLEKPARLAEMREAFTCPMWSGFQPLAIPYWPDEEPMPVLAAETAGQQPPVCSWNMLSISQAVDYCKDKEALKQIN